MDKKRKTMHQPTLKELFSKKSRRDPPEIHKKPVITTTYGCEVTHETTPICGSTLEATVVLEVQNPPEIHEDLVITTIPEHENILENTPLLEIESDMCDNFFTRTEIDIAEAVDLKKKNALTPQHIANIVKYLYIPDSQAKMPSSKDQEGGVTRNLLLKHLSEYPWLVVSDKHNGAYCLPCVLFASEYVGHIGQQVTGKLVVEPLVKFRKLKGNK